jgi:hypothetical protein
LVDQHFHLPLFAPNSVIDFANLAADSISLFRLCAGGFNVPPHECVTPERASEIQIHSVELGAACFIRTIEFIHESLSNFRFLCKMCA